MSQATATAEKSPYISKVEDVGPARKRLTVTIPAELISEKLTDSIGALAASATLPGFRKGKAPKALLEKRFGSAVRDETKNQLVAEAYAKALEENSLDPVQQPDVVGDPAAITLEEGKPLTFSVEIDVVPDFELPALEGIALRRPILEVTDDMVDLEVKRHCTQAGTIVEVNGSLAEGDRIIGNGFCRKKGEETPFFTHEAIDVIIPPEAEGGRGQVLGLMIDGLYAKVIGLGVGDMLKVDVVGPEGHELEHIRGKDLEIELTVRHRQRIEPAPVEEVLSRFGMESETILRDRIRHVLESRIQAESRQAMREQVFEYLMDRIDFALPEKLSESQTTGVIERQRLDLLSKETMTPEEVESKIAETRGDVATQIRRNLKQSFIMHRLSKVYGVRVSDQEVNQRIAGLAMSRGLRPEKLRADLQKSGAIQQVAMQVRDMKAADRVIEKGALTDVPAEEWNKEVQAKKAAAPAKAPAKGRKKG